MFKFSVIIPSVNGLPTIAECLAAIEKQNCEFDFETIVVDRTSDETSDYIRQHFPHVKFIKVSKDCGIPAMRYAAFEQSTGEFLAVTEDHCIAPIDWLSEFAAVHQKGYEVVGGGVANVCSERAVDRAVFLCEYSAFMPPLRDGETDIMTGNNTSYRRSTLENIDSNKIKNRWEYFLLMILRKNNVKFRTIPTLIVKHKKNFDFCYFMAQRFHYSRSFAAMRKQDSNLSELIFYLLYTPLLPIHQIWKIFQFVKKKNYVYRDFFLLLPLLFLFMTSYMFGELFGYLFGAGRSLAKVE